MGLLDLIQQQHAVGVLIDPVGQKAALVEPDIARRRADEPRDGMALHIFRHVKAQEFHAEQVGELFGNFRLADAGRTGEQIVADGLFRLAQAGARQLDGRRKRADGRILTEHDALQVGLQIADGVRIVLRHVLRRNARHERDGVFHFLHADGLATLGFRNELLRCAGLINHVDRLVRQLAVVDVAGRQLHRGLDGVVGVTNLVIVLEIGASGPSGWRSRRAPKARRHRSSGTGGQARGPFRRTGDTPCRSWSRCSAAFPTQGRA